MYKLLAITLALGSVSAADAAPLVVGTGTSNNIFPFGGAIAGFASTNYQQVYAASDFGTAPVTISSISFRLLFGTVTAGNFTLSLSTTSRAVNGLDTVNFAANRGPNSVQIYSGSLAAQLNGSILSFSFSPFTFNPGAGNLLLDVVSSGVPVASAGAFAANNGDAGEVYSRATNFGSGSDDFGLQTIFDVTPAAGVPEPATWALLLVGFGMAGYTLRRRAVAVARCGIA